jgi:hypothetical protein
MASSSSSSSSSTSSSSSPTPNSSTVGVTLEEDATPETATRERVTGGELDKLNFKEVIEEVHDTINILPIPCCQIIACYAEMGPIISISAELDGGSCYFQVR